MSVLMPGGVWDSSSESWSPSCLGLHGRVLGWFKSITFLVHSFLGLLHQFHLRSLGIRSQRLETPTLILPMMDGEALFHPQSLENLFSTKRVPGAKNVGDCWFAEQKDLFLVRGSSSVVRLRIFASVCTTVTTKHPFQHYYFKTKGTAILQHANC